MQEEFFEMIFVTLGTQKFQLNRLLVQLDELCKEGKIEDEIYAQKGHSTYVPKNYAYTDFLSHGEFEEKIMESSLVITHSGVGSIITAMQYRKPVIVYPRMSKFKEHIDDHQQEIAEAFSKKNYVLLCGENDDLGEMIKMAGQQEFKQYVSSTEKVIEIVKDALGR